MKQDSDYASRLAFLSKLSPEDMLEELLAVIHGDGGHYSDQHGLPKAVADAEVRWYGKTPTGARVDAEPEPWTMPSDPELMRFINSTPLVSSLLYDLNLLPECINDPVRWCYMVAVCEHMKAALAAGTIGAAA